MMNGQKKENENNSNNNSNSNNNTQDYELWESLIVFFDCVKEWKIERLMAQCKLDICEIEKKYRDKKRDLVEQYYGTYDFNQVQQHISKEQLSVCGSVTH